MLMIINIDYFLQEKLQYANEQFTEIQKFNKKKIKMLISFLRKINLNLVIPGKFFIPKIERKQSQKAYS